MGACLGFVRVHEDALNLTSIFVGGGYLVTPEVVNEIRGLVEEFTHRRNLVAEGDKEWYAGHSYLQYRFTVPIAWLLGDENLKGPLGRFNVQSSLQDKHT